MEQLPRFVRALMIAMAVSATMPAWSAQPAATPPAVAASVVNINTADAATLAAVLHGVGDAKAQTKIRRRFMALGQTLDSMRVWDIRRAIQMIHFVRDGDVAKVEITASGQMGVNALYASLFESSVRHLELSGLSKSHTESPDYLGVLRFTDIPQVLEAVGNKAVVR